ncbi:MAG TPA: succinylglutamate desuccinylase/aspartoacylase family protein [Myxococcota bacterium]|nr:succinylglutamate desuccinylase/aspartoacylase family protein [Myxococcota bacterium]
MQAFVRWRAAALMLVTSIPTASAAVWPDRVGTAAVRAGEVTRGRLPLLELADGSPVEAPVIVAAGRERGPIAWLLACGHGDEFGGALALQRVARELDPKRMKGLVVLIPVANPPAFQAMRRVNPSLDDLIDFGDAFPGQPRFATERIAATYTALWREHADYVVDLHTGGDRFVQHPFVIFTVTGTVPRDRMEALARSFGVPTLWRDRQRVFESDITINLPAIGIPAFLLEVGGGGSMKRQQDAKQAEYALNFLRGVGVLPGATRSSETPAVVDDYRIVTPTRGGFFYAAVEPGDAVQEGAPLGRVVDVYGDEVEVLRSPVGNAIVLGVQDHPAVASGSWVVELGILETEASP